MIGFGKNLLDTRTMPQKSTKILSLSFQIQSLLFGLRRMIGIEIITSFHSFNGGYL